jgi:prepilin-type N-terminal cleavage/methylation domain-containing protein
VAIKLLLQGRDVTQKSLEGSSESGMFRPDKAVCPETSSRRDGMTLIEVLVALLIAGLTVGAIVSGYTYCAFASEKAALSLAANARAMERIEQTRSATWDTAVYPGIDQFVSSNFPVQVVTLDLSGNGLAATYATNITQIVQMGSNPPLKRVRVECVWKFRTQIMTNSVEIFRSPDA